MTTCACGSETLHPATPDQNALQLGGGAEGRSHAKRPEGQSLATSRRGALLLERSTRGSLAAADGLAPRAASRVCVRGRDRRLASGPRHEPIDPVEIVVPAGSGVRSRTGLSVRHCEISAREIVSVRGLRATSVHRTLSDLCLRGPAVEALVAIDMALASRLTDPAALRRHAEATKGRAGSRGLKSLASLAAPAESPVETRLRWLLIKAGLPHPDVQTDLCDSSEQFVGRADLYYPAARLVLEYDGGNHRERLVEDDRRQNLLINAGFRLLRFTAADIHRQPDVVVAQVRAALTPASDNARLAQNARNPARRNAGPDPNGRNWWRGTLRGGVTRAP